MVFVFDAVAMCVETVSANVAGDVAWSLLRRYIAMHSFGILCAETYTDTEQ